MPRLVDFTSYADARRHFSKAALWELFDGRPERFNIAHECLDRHPAERVAVRVARAEGGDDTYTFGELAAWSGRFANWLVRRGVGPGERIAIMLEPSLAFYAALFGTMKAGAVAVPMFTLFGPEALRPRLKDCRPRLLLTDGALAATAAAAGAAEVIVADETFLAALARYDAAFAPATTAADMAMYQYTSGTTRALPEAVKHRHRALVTVMIAALYATGIRPGDRFMCPSSPAWGHGLWHGTLAPLALGVATAAYAGRFDPARLMQAIEAYRITNLSAAATHYRMMKNAGVVPRRPLRIAKLTFTGEPIDGETEAWAGALFGTPPRSIYGSTEVGVVLAGYPGAADFAVRPGSLGKPLPGVEVAVIDAAGRPCPAGEIGEIAVRRHGAWIRLHDLGHVDEGGYFWHDGRADDVVISAGWTISAREIENVLHAHPDVEEAAVIAVADDERGQVAKAFVVAQRPGDAAFARELREFVRRRLSRHAYPRRVAFVDALPKTPAGKINRGSLRALEAAARQGEPPL